MKVQFQRTTAVVLVLQLSLGLAGCDTPAIFARWDQNETPAANPARVRAMRLQPGEKIRVVVYGEDKLTGEYEIDPAGSITIPLAGPVQAASLTLKELAQAITRKLESGQILRNPVVTVNVASFRPFYVLGEVEKPGQYPFSNGLNVMSAAAVAGGYTYRASKSVVMIQRAGEKTFTEFPLSPNVPVFPGDLIRVPERYF